MRATPRKPLVIDDELWFDYIKERCTYMSEDDIAMIRGGNARRVYGL